MVETEANINLKQFQNDFIFSTARYPAMISAWGTGKSLCLILRAMFYSNNIPNNLGVIFRKEYVDLRDSTMRDFENFTGLKVDSQRNVNLLNGSRIMFRHIEELNNIQNINLGWFGIEQAEELKADKEFFLLWGRLRRKLLPSQEFLDTGLSVHSGFIVGNVAGANWIKALWKDASGIDFKLIEAKTFDNDDILPKEYIDSLEQLKSLKPDIYNRFVLNDWMVEAEGKILKSHYVDACVDGNFISDEIEAPIEGENYDMGVDLAKYNDYTVLITIKKSTNKVVNFQRFNETSWNLQKQKIIATATRYSRARIIPDSTGVGDPIVEDLQREGMSVYYDRKAGRDGFKFTNTSKEQLIENLIIAIEQKKVTFPKIEVLIDELKDFEIEITEAGNRRYGAPGSKHDDCVIALALALWPVNKGRPNIRFL